jgi:hypothetical protein
MQRRILLEIAVTEHAKSQGRLFHDVEEPSLCRGEEGERTCIRCGIAYCDGGQTQAGPLAGVGMKSGARLPLFTSLGHAAHPYTTPAQRWFCPRKNNAIVDLCPRP